MTDNPQHKDNFDGWCAALGYYKDDPVRNSIDLLRVVRLFAATFESRGEELPTSQTITGPLTRKCAHCFLTENDEDKAKVYFGDVVTRASQVCLVWPDDREQIQDVMSQIFRLRSFYNYQTRLKREKDEAYKRSTGRDASEISPTSKKRRRAKSASLTQRTENVRIEDCQLENGLAAIDTYHTLNIWAAPPNRPNSKALLEYIQELLVSRYEGLDSELTREWLSLPNPKWPDSADKLLQIYMHEHNLYVLPEDEVPLGLRLCLFRETQLACITEGEQNRLNTVMCGRIQHHSERLLQLCYLEETDDGDLHKSKRFKAIWEQRSGRGSPQDDEEQPPVKRQQRLRKRAAEEVQDDDLNDEHEDGFAPSDYAICMPELPEGAEIAEMYGWNIGRTSIPETESELHPDTDSGVASPRSRSISPSMAVISPSSPMRPTNWTSVVESVANDGQLVDRTEFNSTQFISPSSSSAPTLSRRVIGGKTIAVGISGIAGALRTPDYSPPGRHNESPPRNNSNRQERERPHSQHQPFVPTISGAESGSRKSPTPLFETISKLEENISSMESQQDTSMSASLGLTLSSSQPGSTAANPIILEFTQNSEQFDGEEILASEDPVHEQTEIYGPSPDSNSLPVSNSQETSLVYTSMTRDSDEANVENFKEAEGADSYNDFEDPTQRKTLIVKLRVSRFHPHNLRSSSNTRKHERVRTEVLDRDQESLNLVNEPQPVPKKRRNRKKKSPAVGDEATCTLPHPLKSATIDVTQEICKVGSLPESVTMEGSTSASPLTATGASIPFTGLTLSSPERSPINLGCAIKRDGSYAYKPFPESFSTIPSPPLSQRGATPPNNPVQVSAFSEFTDSTAPSRALSLTSLKAFPVLSDDITMSSSKIITPYAPSKSQPQPQTPTYNLVLECSDGALNYGTLYPSTILKTCTLDQFFEFFSTKSGYSLQGLTALRLIASFAKGQAFVVRKRGIVGEWKQVRNRLHILWEVARRKCSAGSLDKDEVEWEVLVETCD